MGRLVQARLSATLANRRQLTLGRMRALPARRPTGRRSSITRLSRTSKHYFIWAMLRFSKEMSPRRSSDSNRRLPARQAILAFSTISGWRWSAAAIWPAQSACFDARWQPSPLVSKDLQTLRRTCISSAAMRTHWRHLTGWSSASRWVTQQSGQIAQCANAVAGTWTGPSAVFAGQSNSPPASPRFIAMSGRFSGHSIASKRRTKR